MLLKEVTWRGPTGTGVPREHGWMFWCPGCRDIHMFVTHDAWGPRWQFVNRDMLRPTFTPSLMINRDLNNPIRYRCHLILTDGVLNYCNDCTHPLSGQRIAMAPLPEDWR